MRLLVYTEDENGQKSLLSAEDVDCLKEAFDIAYDEWLAAEEAIHWSWGPKETLALATGYFR